MPSGNKRFKLDIQITLPCVWQCLITAVAKKKNNNFVFFNVCKSWLPSADVEVIKTLVVFWVKVAASYKWTALLIVNEGLNQLTVIHIEPRQNTGEDDP